MTDRQIHIVQAWEGVPAGRHGYDYDKQKVNVAYFTNKRKAGEFVEAYCEKLDNALWTLIGLLSVPYPQENREKFLLDNRTELETLLNDITPIYVDMNFVSVRSADWGFPLEYDPEKRHWESPQYRIVEFFRSNHSWLKEYGVPQRLLLKDDDTGETEYFDLGNPE